ncbi:hypothetical protein [Streptomyces sp. NPDC005573]|uniref:hypothetical protein n=1 Tax=unclassified Streptomyces TaxID=2593676 RepID=UPI00339E6AF5
MSDNTDLPATAPARSAHLLFDLRSIIAALFGIYGVVLTAMGATGASGEELRKSGGWNVNLWCGIAMLALTASFAAWVILRPTPAPDASVPAAEPEAERAVPAQTA